MNEKPYKYDKVNPRLVTNCAQNPNVMYLSGAIFLMSMNMYNNRTFRIDKNALNFIMFAGASAFASFQWASLLMDTSIN